MSLPKLPPGRPTSLAQTRYDAEVRAFAKRILEINSQLEFRVSSRGWAYILENAGVINKGDFDTAQRLINTCRKNGLLPLDICADDSRRSSDGIERLDGDIEQEIATWRRLLRRAPDFYTPLSFWENQEFYIEIAVEKIDLKNLFAPVCAEFRIPITNIAGWSDLNCRAAMLGRFAWHARANRQPVLLYCGDHDPGGQAISGFLRANLEELTPAVGWSADADLIIERFGLDADFINELGLTWIDNLETGSGKRLDDPRHKDHRKKYVQNYLKQFGARKVEANALVVRPAEGRALCCRAIAKYISQDAPQHYRKRLETHRAALREALGARFGDGAAQ